MKKTARSEHAGPHFPLGGVFGLLRRGNYAQHLGAGSQIYLNAVNDYLAVEMLELTGNAAHNQMKTGIIPSHVVLVINNN